jgi:uncharacterized membrane protein YdbT with pleckstrin-like domain/DNA-directed RNA polymerase subunit RPC12/RpoP
MFCIKCGTKNTDEAVFCQKCGYKFTVEDETKIEKPLIDDEKKIFSIRPTLMFVHTGYAAAIASAFLLVAVLYYLGQIIGVSIPWQLSVFGGLALLLIPAFYHFKRNVLLYTLTDAKVEIDEGFISRASRKIPLRAIQDVTVHATIPQRLFGIGDVIIENANEADERIVMKNIGSPQKYADLLLNQVRLLHK